MDEPSPPAAPAYPPPPPAGPFPPTASYPAPPPFLSPPPAPARDRRVRRFLQQYGGPIVLAAVVVAAVATGSLSKDPDPGPYPDEWDPRVTDIVAFVERERGLTFEHPVYVDFLSEADYQALAGDSVAPDPATVAWFADESTILQAQGLVADGYDALAGAETSLSDLSLGFYSPDVGRMVVRGTELTPAVRVVLAHELTHALQDQHFGLLLGGDNGFVLRAVVEADALRIDAAYHATMSAADQAAADVVLAGDEDAGSTLPWTVVDQFYAPYLLGPTLVDAAFELGGNAGVDYLLRNVPTEEVLFNPWLPTTETDEHVGFTPLDDGQTSVREDAPLSYFTLLAMLDAWLPWDQTRLAMAGWEGGGQRSFEEDGRLCVELGIIVADPDLLAAALDDWAAAAGSTAAAEVHRARVDVVACERDDGAAPPEPTISTVVATWIEAQVMADGDIEPDDAGLAAVHCFTHSVIESSAAEVIVMAEPSAADQARLDDAKAAAREECGLPD